MHFKGCAYFNLSFPRLFLIETVSADSRVLVVKERAENLPVIENRWGKQSEEVDQSRMYVDE